MFRESTKFLVFGSGSADFGGWRLSFSTVSGALVA